MKKLISLMAFVCWYSTAFAAEPVENCRTLSAEFKSFFKQYEPEISGHGVDTIFKEGQLSFRYSAVRAVFDVWVFMDASNQGHLLRLEGLEQHYGVPLRKIRFSHILPRTDITTVEVQLTLADDSGMYYHGDMTIGGTKIYVKVYFENRNYPATQLTWGEGATYGEVGVQTDRFDCDAPFPQPVSAIKNCRGVVTNAISALASYKTQFPSVHYQPPVLVEGERSYRYTAINGRQDSWVVGSRVLLASKLQTTLQGISTNKISFVDVSSKETFEAILDTRQFVSGFLGSGIVPHMSHQGTFTLDGTTVFVQVVYILTTTYPSVQLTWGTGATYGLVGEAEDRFDCEPLPSFKVIGISTNSASVGKAVKLYTSGLPIALNAPQYFVEFNNTSDTPATLDTNGTFTFTVPNMASGTYAVSASVYGADPNVYKTTAGRVLTENTLAFTVKTVSVQVGSLTVSFTSGEQTVIAGQKQVWFGSHVFDATASSEDIRVTIVPGTYDVSNGGNPSDLTNMRLYDGANPITTGSNVLNPVQTGQQAITVDGTGFIVSKGTIKTLKQKADVRSGVTGTYKWSAPEYLALTFTAATGLASTMVVPEVFITTAPFTLKVVPSGEFVVGTDTLTPPASTVKPGDTGVTVLIAKLFTSLEEQKLERFGLTFTGSNMRVIKNSQYSLYVGSIKVGEGVFVAGLTSRATIFDTTLLPMQSASLRVVVDVSEEAGHGDTIAFESSAEDTSTTGLVSGSVIKPTGSAKGNTLTVERPGGGGSGGGGGGGGGPVLTDISSEMLKDIEFRQVQGEGPYTGRWFAIVWLNKPFEVQMILDISVGNEHWQSKLDSNTLFRNTAGPVTTLAFILPEEVCENECLREDVSISIFTQ
ncbi:MAG: hypothetical protein Q7S86_02845 [bacterium]|nr:hypothetical protein [bacterium]